MSWARSSRPSASAIFEAPVGRVPSPGGSVDADIATPTPAEPPPRRLRRLHRMWPDRDGNSSCLLNLCVNGRERVLDNDPVFDRFVAFLFDSPARYGWFGRRFVIMPDHVHLIAHMGREAIRVGQWIKALKAVVGGLEHRSGSPSEEADSGDIRIVGHVPPHAGSTIVGRVPSPGVRVTRIPSRMAMAEGISRSQVPDA